MKLGLFSLCRAHCCRPRQEKSPQRRSQQSLTRWLVLASRSCRTPSLWKWAKPRAGIVLADVPHVPAARSGIVRLLTVIDSAVGESADQRVVVKGSHHSEEVDLAIWARMPTCITLLRSLSAWTLDRADARLVPKRPRLQDAISTNAASLTQASCGVSDSSQSALVLSDGPPVDAQENALNAS